MLLLIQVFSAPPQICSPTEFFFFLAAKRWLYRPIRGSVVAIVGQEVEVELPEDVERDSSVGGGHIVVGLAEHGVEAVQGHVLAQQAVGQSVDLQQPLQLLTGKKTGKRRILVRVRGKKKKRQAQLSLA